VTSESRAFTCRLATAFDIMKTISTKLINLLPVIRGVSGFFAFILIWAYFSFLEYQDMTDTVRIWGIALALLVFAIIPRSLLTFALTKVIVFLLGVFGIVATIPMMRNDLLLINGADYPAFVMRSVMVGILLIMIIEPFLKNPKSKSVEQSVAGYPLQDVGPPDP